MINRTLKAVCVVIACAVPLMTGCVSKQGNDNKSVSIKAPGASIHVDEATIASDSGMPAYPGAKEIPNMLHERNHKRVDINALFWKVKIVKLKYTSDDAPEKILAFYRGKLGRYGNVLECKGVGQEVIGNDSDSPVRCKQTGNPEGTSLKVGTEGNQHIVRVNRSGKGSEFELVLVQKGDSKSNDNYEGKQPS